MSANLVHGGESNRLSLDLFSRKQASAINPDTLASMTAIWADIADSSATSLEHFRLCATQLG